MGESGAQRRVAIVVGAVALVVVLAVVLIVVRYRQPLPAVTTAAGEVPKAAPGAPPNLPWPTRGSASVGVDQVGVVGTTTDDRPRTLASVTKIMTALVILEGHPLATGERGPAIAVTDADVRAYHAAIAEDQSAVPVAAGTSLTQYQMLQALLLPSGNNIADMLAVWDAGSTQAFIAKMNARAAALGMKDTRYADTSGNNPASAGSSRDQTVLAQLAMKNATFAEIVAQPQADIPVAGVMYNVNRLVGTGGNIGVKTGSGFEDGASFVFAVQTQGAAGPQRVIGAVLGQAQLEPAFAASQALAAAAAQGVRSAEVIRAGQPVAYLESAWGERVPVLTSQGATFLVWPGAALDTRVEVTVPPLGAGAGSDAGRLVVRLGDQQQEIALKTGAPLLEPSSTWRVFR